MKTIETLKLEWADFTKDGELKRAAFKAFCHAPTVMAFGYLVKNRRGPTTRTVFQAWFHHPRNRK